MGKERYISREDLLEDYSHKYSSRSLIKMFYDFYAIDALYYFIKDKPLNHKRKQKIAATKEETTIALAKLVESALERSVRSEAAYCFNSPRARFYNAFNNVRTCDSNGINSYFWAEFVYSNDELRFIDFENNRNFFYDKIDLKYIDLFFGAYIWLLSYGGPKWKIATELLIELKKELAGDQNLNKITLICDKIFDLQHNTGFIFSKVEFKCLNSRKKLKEPIIFKGKRRIMMSPLDIRFNLGRLTDYLPHCSNSMKKLIISNKSYI